METYFVDSEGWAATPWLRFVEINGHNVLQQLMAKPEQRKLMWRDVPLAVPGEDHPELPSSRA